MAMELMQARGLRQAQPERNLLLRFSHPSPLSLSLSKHVLSFAEGATRDRSPA